MEPMKLNIQLFATPLPVKITINFKDISEDELPENLTFSFDGEQAIIQITGISGEYTWTSSTGGNVFNSITIETEGYSIIAYQKGGPIDIDVYKNYGFVKKILEDNTVNQTKPDFTQSAITDEGMFSAQDSDGNSTYFRGAVINNYVKFADFWWRIVRINGDGSVRVIYDGTVAHTNGEDSSDRHVGKCFWTDRWDRTSCVGYTFDSGAQRPTLTTYDSHDSWVKNVVDKWFVENMLDYISYIDANAGFWNDREAGPGYTWEVAPYTRFDYAYDASRRTGNPSLSCEIEGDLYTYYLASRGNTLLRYPVGIITKDECDFAGVKNASSANYLSIGSDNFWTMTPGGYDSEYSWQNVYSSTNQVCPDYGVYTDYELGVRPVINLRGNLSITGNGTVLTPYEILPENNLDFNGTKTSYVYYNGASIKEIYFNGTKIFGEAKTELPLRRLREGDYVENKNIYGFFNTQTFSQDSPITAKTLVTFSDGTTLKKEVNTSSVAEFNMVDSGGTELGNLFTANNNPLSITSQSPYYVEEPLIVSSISDDWEAIGIYIEDENLKFLEVGDSIWEGTIFYFCFPEIFNFLGPRDYNDGAFISGSNFSVENEDTNQYATVNIKWGDTTSPIYQMEWNRDTSLYEPLINSSGWTHFEFSLPTLYGTKFQDTVTSILDYKPSYKNVYVDRRTLYEENKVQVKYYDLNDKWSIENFSTWGEFETWVSANKNNLHSIEIATYGTTDTISFNHLFNGAQNLINVDLRYMKGITQSIDFTRAFSECPNLVSFFCGDFDISAASYMFYNDTSLEYCSLGYCKGIHQLNSTFEYTDSLASIDNQNETTGQYVTFTNVGSMDRAFYNSAGLQNFDFHYWQGVTPNTIGDTFRNISDTAIVDFADMNIEEVAMQGVMQVHGSGTAKFSNSISQGSKDAISYLFTDWTVQYYD